MSNSSNHNPELKSPPLPDPVAAIQPNAPDFIETPEVAPLSLEKEPLPLWLFFICGFALFMAGSSFTGLGTFGLGLCDQGPGGPALAGGSQAAVAAPATPMDLGKKLFSNNCANCHQASGVGQPGSYPPLVNSEWVLGSKERLAAILLKGIQGPLTVEGASYGTQAMPAQVTLTPEKIADVMTYLRASWGNTAGPVTPDEVTAAKALFDAHAGAWSEADLLKIAPNGPDPTDKKP